MTTSEGNSASIRVVLAVGNAARERELHDALAERGFAVVGRCLDGPSLAERAQAFDSDVGLASSDLHRLSVSTLSVIREARLPLVLLSDQADFERYAGLAHCMVRAAPAQEVVGAVQQAAALGVSYAAPSVNGAGSTAMDGGAHGGHVLAVLGGKGAPGVTTLAIGLAGALNERGRRVVLVDADMRGGNVVPYLDLDPSRGLLGLSVGRHGASDALPVEEELQEGPGFAVLAGIERPESHGALSPELAGAAVAQLREMYDDVVVDLGEVVAGLPTTVPQMVARLADRILVVAGSDLLGAWNAQRCIRSLRDEAGLPPDSLGVLLNRHADGGYGAREIEHALGADVLATVPDDRRVARRAVADQVPITEVSRRARRSLRLLAAHLCEGSQPTMERRTRRRPLRARLLPIGRR